ncbi:MAG: hypothetical protein ACR65X_07685 [Methylocystis sp.]
MSPLERDLRERGNEVRGISILCNGEAAHESAHLPRIEDVENDEPRRAARDDAAFAQKDGQRGPRVRGQRQRTAQLMNELTACDPIEIHLSLHQYQQRSA